MKVPVDSENTLLQSAFIARLIYDESIEQLSWSGCTEPFSPYFNDSLPENLGDLCARLHPASAAALKLFFISGEKCESFPLEFLNQRADSKNTFVVTLSDKRDAKECYLHVLGKALDRIDFKLADRSGAETNRAEERHHRAKNILQSVISYLNILIGSRDGLSKQEINRVSRYLHLLAGLHDVMHDQLISREPTDVVRLDRVFLALFSRASLENNISWNDIPALVVKSARAASLGLLMNEILDLVCLDVERSSAVLVEINIQAGSQAEVGVSRSLAFGETDLPVVATSSGLRIIESLTKAKRQATFELVKVQGRLVAKLKFEIN